MRAGRLLEHDAAAAKARKFDGKGGSAKTAANNDCRRLSHCAPASRRLHWA
jgi:hypothetical protein